ncbi:MAG: citrate synthase family protein [Anaerolineae bacterium]|nr:citrate synthase family protein [Anaerolineae bacterium]
MTQYLSAGEACERLGVKEATLYAYVSRGLIRSEVGGGTTRKRRYLAEDVDKLVGRKEQRRDPAKVVEDALHWGVPLLDSSITLIADGRLYFRGQDAAELARSQLLEDVAALIWLDDMDAMLDLFRQPFPKVDLSAFAHLNLPMMARLQMALTLASVQDFAAYDLSAAGAARTGARILKGMGDALPPPQPSPASEGGSHSRMSIAETLAAAWSTEAAHLLNAAMVLCADHELNASSFAARVTASVDANPYAVVQAGLAALQGLKHGGHTSRVTAFMREVGQVERVQQVIGERLRRGDDLPGFGHRLYPEGDPRAQALMAMLAEHAPDSPDFMLATAIAQAVTGVSGKLPTIDFALATLEWVLGLPDGAALALFALGRTVGWIGHAIEQYRAGAIIRPRARYVGRVPNG